MKQNSKAQILMMGTKPGHYGGIAAVVKGYKDAGIFDRLGIEYITTHCVGGPAAKVFTYILGVIRFVLKLPCCRIIHIHTASRWSFRRFYPIIVLTKIFGKKLILHLHGGQFDTYYSNASMAEKRLIRHGFSLSDRTVVLSRDWFTRLEPFCNRDTMMLITNGVKLEPKCQNRVDIGMGRPIMLLFLGEIVKRKGVYDLLDAISVAAPALPQIEVCICGRGEVLQAKRYAAEKGIAHLVNFPGWVGGEEKKRLLNNAQLFVLPSYAECFPVSILEAMAHGIPVVATNVGGVSSIVEHGVEGVLVPVADVRSLATALISLICDEGKRSRMSEAALAKVTIQFSMQRISELLSCLYTELY